MTPIDQHALNQLLAKWAGVEVEEVDSDDCSLSLWVVQPAPLVKWDPLTDANQLELVKAGLRKEGIGYEVHWDEFQKTGWAAVTTPYYGRSADQRVFEYIHESEAMALALSIQAMEEGH